MQSFKNLQTLKNYTNKYGRFQKGEMVQTIDDNKIYMYNNGWEEVEQKVINTGTSLYDFNKQIMSQLEPFNLNQWEEAEKKITNWDEQKQATYYMLLCKELSYYTVFINDGYEFDNFGESVRKYFEFVDGNVVDINIEKDKIEIWLKKENDIYYFVLFNYDMGVISFKR